MARWEFKLPDIGEGVTEGEAQRAWAATAHPARAAVLYGEVRQRLGMVPPRLFSKAGALFSGLDSSVVGMASASARLSNARIKHDLDMTLRYPSFRAWLDQRLAPAAPLERAATMG
jgi:hypothetical protein